MQSNYELLGKYIRQVDERNTFCNDYKLLGVSIEKRFLPSIANTIGTDFSKYKIVRQGQFAYGPVTSRNGDKISVALLEEQNCLISSSYTAFEVIDKELLAPEYLMLWFKRPEFDRYARFKSHGSAREIFDWEQMCAVELRIPNIEEQRKVLSIIQVIQKRIAVLNQLNNYLADTQQALFRKYACQCNEDIEIGEIADVIDCLHSKKPTRKEEGKLLLQLNNIRDDGLLDCTEQFLISDADYKKWISRCEATAGDIVITNVGRVGAASQVPRGVKAALGRNMTCVRSRAEHHYPSVLITALTSKSMQHEIANKTDTGTIMNALNVRNIPKLRIPFDSYDGLEKLEKQLAQIQDYREKSLRENQHLVVLRDALLPKLMSGEIDVSKVDLTPLNNHLSTL